MALYDLKDQRQPDAIALVLAFPHQSLEGLEDALDLALVEADPIVFDYDRD
jgi:hypothetical protein